MNIFDYNDQNVIKIKDYTFKLMIKQVTDNKCTIDVAFRKAPDLFKASIFVDILNMIKPSIGKDDRIALSGATYKNIKLFDALDLKESVWKFNTIEDEIEKYVRHSDKQLDLSEPFRVANVKKAKAERVLEFLKKKHTKIDQFDISLSYVVFPNVRFIENKFVSYIDISITIVHHTENFRSENRELYANFKNNLKEELLEFIPFDMKKNDDIEIFTQYSPLK